jgi:glycosyltransferase involved in cell wall biosynthesis
MKPYRLCFVDSIRSWGGAEVWFLETALALRAAGYAAGVVAQPGSALLDRARAAGVAAAAIPIRFDAAPWTLIKLARHFRASGTTAIVANLTKDLKAAAVAGRLAGVPTILATRESDFPLKDKFYYRWYFTRLATGMLVNSRATGDTVTASVPWLKAGNVHLVYKGIDSNRFRPGPVPDGPPVVGFVGQLIDRKGIAELMAAWAAIDRRDRPDRPVLRLAGTGPLRGRLESWRSGLLHPERVELAGFVEDIAAFYRGLTMLVLPSHAEGFGLAAAEAAATGLPVIASNASSLPEIVLDRQTGLLVPPRAAAPLAAAIGRLLDDPALGRRLGAAGREHVSRHFDRDATLHRLLQLTGAPARQPTKEDRP